MANIKTIERTDRPAKTRAKVNEVVGRSNLKTNVGNGAAAVTNIAVAGITTADELQSVIMFASGVPSDVTSEASITSAGNIRLSTTNSTGNKLVINWYDKV